MAVAVAGVHIGGAVVARHRAQAAADLAALAAAARVPAGAAPACAEAIEVSTAMGASLRDCRIESLDVVLTVAAATRAWPRTDAYAAARAGPVDQRAPPAPARPARTSA